MAEFEVRHRDGAVYKVLVDDEDYERVIAAGPWNVQRTSHGSVYFRHSLPRPERGVLLLHRFIMGAGPDEVVDHRDTHNTLDNRKSNLRKCTNAQNSRNQKLRKCNTSGLKGVSFEAFTKRWKAQICVNGRNHNLGRYDTREEAHAAYCAASARMHGEFGRTA